MGGKNQGKKNAGFASVGGATQRPIDSSCGVSKCKEKGKRFGFCQEHFRQFKFGLIKKNGQPVPDFEKKLEHYNAYQERCAAQKVA